MRSLMTGVALLAVALMAAGCGGGADELRVHSERSLALGQPVVMNEAMVFLDKENQEIVVVRSEVVDGTPNLEAERHRTGKRPVQMKPAADGSSLYVLNRDDRTLSVFEIGAEEVERADVELDSVYDRITMDPFGEFVLLSNSGDAKDAVAQNLNELGIIDVRDGIPERPDVLSLPVAAMDLQLGPPFEMEGEPQRLAAALAPDEVAIVDLHAEADYDRVRTAPLSPRDSKHIHNPTQVLFDVPAEGSDRKAVSLFVLDDRGNDVTQIMVQPSIRPDQHHKFDVSLNQLAAGDNPAHITVLDLGDVGKRLVALDGSSPRFTVVDISSTEAATFDLPMTQPARGLHTYFHDVPGQDRIEKRLLAYSPHSSRVAVIRPEQISLGSQTASPGQAVDQIRLSQPPSQVLIDDAGDVVDRAVVLHGGGDDGFTVLNLETNRETTWTGHTLAHVVVDGSHGYGIFANSPHLLRVDLEELRSQIFELPETGRQIHLSADNETVLVQHDGAAGRFTVMPRGDLGLESAVQYEHVFLREILNRHDDVEEANDSDDDSE